MAGGFHLTSALAFLNKGEGQWSDGGKSNMENEDDDDYILGEDENDKAVSGSRLIIGDRSIMRRGRGGLRRPSTGGD